MMTAYAAKERCYRYCYYSHYYYHDHCCSLHVLVVCRLIAYSLAAALLAGVKALLFTSATTTVAVKSCYVVQTNDKHVLFAATLLHALLFCQCMLLLRVEGQ